MPSVVALPIPNSWYAVAFSDELRPGGVLARTVAEQELVVFRTRAGEACAMDAYCPHLGAHLGIGETVEGETIRCPCGQNPPAGVDLSRARRWRGSSRTIHQSAIHDAGQDFVIWENKRHIQPPALAQGDGPIGPFRVWARQFYAQPAMRDGERALAETPATATSG